MAWTPPRKSINDLIPLVEVSSTAEGRVALPVEVAFEWDDLVLSLARTMTMATPIEGQSQEERREFALTLAQGAAARIDLLVEKGNPEFCFSSRLEWLADNLRTSLAGEVGAAITDLTMEGVGFHWRANGREVDFVIPAGEEGDNRIPDFVYDPGATAGFALGSIAAVEAKGSLSKTGAKRAAIKRLARNAFKGQVAKYLGAQASGCVVAAGFAVAYGGAPGSNTSTLVIASSHEFQAADQPLEAAFSLSAASSSQLQPEPLQVQQEPELEIDQHHPQPQHERQGVEIEFERDHQPEEAETGDSGRGGRFKHDGGGERPRGRPSRRVAVANYEAVFQMCGAYNAANFLRNLLSERSEAEPPAGELIQEFWVVGEGDEPVLMGDTWSWWWWDGYLGVAQRSAEEILRIVASEGELPTSFELGIIPPDRRRTRTAKFQGDGLAWVDDRWTSRYPRHWDLRKGDWLD